MRLFVRKLDQLATVRKLDQKGTTCLSDTDNETSQLAEVGPKLGLGLVPAGGFGARPSGEVFALGGWHNWGRGTTAAQSPVQQLASSSLFPQGVEDHLEDLHHKVII